MGGSHCLVKKLSVLTELFMKQEFMKLLQLVPGQWMFFLQYWSEKIVLINSDIEI